MISILKKLINLLYENSCTLCKSNCKDLVFCKNCESKLEERKELYKKTFNEINIYSWGFYDGNLRDSIISLKNGKKKLAKFFGLKLSIFWETLNLESKDYLVLPIPSHKKRNKERGYCQTELIGKEFSENLKFRFSKNCLIREKETLFMNKLNLNERAENINGAFKIVNSLDSEKNIILLDDILTTGSTMCEIARTIHKDHPNINLIGLTVAAGDTWDKV